MHSQNRLILLLLVLFPAASIFAQAPPKRPLIEKFTSTACGSCANGTLVLADLLDQNPNAIAVAHHVSIFDSMTIDDALTTFHYYAGGTPMAVVNRDGSGTTYNNWESRLQQQQGLFSPLSVAVDSMHFDPQTRIVTVRVATTFFQDVNHELRFNAFLTEDDVTGGSGYHQRNYNNNTPGHPLEGLGHPILGFVHQHVLRSMMGGPFGVNGSLAGTTFLAGETYTHTFQDTLPTNVNEYKVHVVALVQEYGGTMMDREVLNSDETSLTLVLNREEEEIFEGDLQVGPNPLDHSGKVNFVVLETGQVSLKLLDLHGREVANLYEGFATAGAHSVELQAATLPSGVYLAVLASGEQRLSRRVVIAHP